MKIAVCFSGQPRHFAISHPYWESSLNGQDVDYFAHLWFDPSKTGSELEIYSEGRRGQRSGYTVRPNTDTEFIDLYKPKSYQIEPQIEFVDDMELHTNNGKPSQTRQPPDIFISMLYSRWKSGELMKTYAAQNNIQYDLLIWTRTDVAVTTPIRNEISSLDHIYTGDCHGDIWNTTHVTTGIIASKPENMLHFLDLYNTYPTLFTGGVDFCDHRMSFYQLQQLGCDFKPLLTNNWFWIRRDGLVPGFK